MKSLYLLTCLVAFCNAEAEPNPEPQFGRGLTGLGAIPRGRGRTRFNVQNPVNFGISATAPAQINGDLGAQIGVRTNQIGFNGKIRNFEGQIGLGIGQTTGPEAISTGRLRLGISTQDLEDLVNEEWLAFKLTYNKTYASPEIENFRREIFIENRAKIAKFNQEYGQGRRSFVQQLNPYGDMLFHEFFRNLNGYNRTNPNARNIPIPNGSTYIPSANVILPENMDWRQVGAVSPVKSQGLCAGCWAFAAAGALEGHNFRKTGNLVELSPQNLIDCTRENGNNGCQGGNINPAFEYVRDNPGIDTEESYPYEARDAECRFREDTVGGVCTGYVDIAEGDEKGLEIAVATIGPVAAAIDASRESLQFYSDGIYYDAECSNQIEGLNHAVLVVGFGTEPDGQKYWLIKNSYGQQWGIGGYIKLAKDAGNHCGIASAASYPLV